MGAVARRLESQVEETSGAVLFEFICERLIPGCHHRDQDEKEEELLERATEHIRVHHTTDHFDEPVDEALKTVGIQFVKPA